MVHLERGSSLCPDYPPEPSMALHLRARIRPSAPRQAHRNYLYPQLFQIGRLIIDFNFGRASGSWQTEVARPMNLVPSGLLPPLPHSSMGLSSLLLHTTVKVSPLPGVLLGIKLNTIERALLISLQFWRQMNSFKAFQNQKRGREGQKEWKSGSLQLLGVGDPPRGSG